MEDIIYRYLCSIFNELEGFSTYMNVPSVFNTNAPDDTDENWGETQYPRLIFELNMQANPERNISGQLFVDVMCENEKDSIQPETLSEMIKESVDGCFFSSNELTISCQWSGSENFKDKDKKVSGITIIFDVLDYPLQGTGTDPDPINATNLWLKTLYQNAKVIGYDDLPDVWKPTDESPAIYCGLYRLGESSRMKSTACVDWYGAELHVNVISPTKLVRSTICTAIVHILSKATRIILSDGSPMLIDKVISNMTSDPMKVGQVVINATYGVLPDKNPVEKLNHAYISGMCAESEV